VSGSIRYYAATDQLGSVTQVLDASAKVVWTSEYTAFGVVAGAQGSISFSGMFAGEDIDPDTGLTYHWNRWRSEDGSSFISEDPARDGINWYSYVRNSPLTSTDPTGLWGWSNFWKDAGIVLAYAAIDVAAFCAGGPVGLAVALGAEVGSYVGGSIANHNFDPSEWNWGSGSTWEGMGIGAVAGAALGYAAYFAPGLILAGNAKAIAAYSGFILGAEVGGSEINHSADPRKWDWYSAKTWEGMGIGGVIGAIGAYTGESLAIKGAASATSWFEQAMAYGTGYGVGNAITGGLDAWAFGDVDNGFFQGNVGDTVKAAVWSFAYGFVGGFAVGALTPLTDSASSEVSYYGRTYTAYSLQSDLGKDAGKSALNIVWNFVRNTFTNPQLLSIAGENLVPSMNVYYEATRAKVEGKFAFKLFGFLDITGVGAAILGGLFRPILFSSDDRDSCPGWSGSLSDGSVTHQF